MNTYVSELLPATNPCVERDRDGKRGKGERGSWGRQETTHVVIQLPKDEHEFALDVAGARERVVGFAEAERVRVEVGGKVADCGGDAGVEGAAVGEVSA